MLKRLDFKEKNNLRRKFTDKRYDKKLRDKCE